MYGTNDDKKPVIHYLQEEYGVDPEMYEEMDAFDKEGIRISVSGVPASPLQVAEACAKYGRHRYMRDYIIEEGVIREIRFDLLRDFGND